MMWSRRIRNSLPTMTTYYSNVLFGQHTEIKRHIILSTNGKLTNNLLALQSNWYVCPVVLSKLLL